MITLQKTKDSAPPRMLIHGGEKIGKSTFCAQASDPVFLPTEEGLKGINANAAVPEGKGRLETWEEFDEALSFVEANKEHFQSVIVDSADWLELLIHQKICRDFNKDNIAEAAGGYGKGYLVAMDYWTKVLNRLDALNKAGKWVILICHSKSILYNDPNFEPYDLWTMKLHSPKSQNGSLELLKEWADIISFAMVEKFVSESKTTKAKDTGDRVHRAIETGKRKLHFEPSQAFLAGNRYGLKDSCELSWNSFIDKFAETKNNKQH